MSFATSSVLHGQHGVPVKVLIADDHPVVRQGLKQMLSADPELEVVGEARDGDEAFEKAHQVEWDVAVLDYSMPGRGGVELLSDVKHDYPERPVLILSIYPEDPHGLRALKAGAAGYVLKQVKGNDLIDGIRRVARGESLLDPALTARVLERLRSKPEPDELADLTPQERKILDHIAEGLTNRQIGERMFLAEKTVKNYVSNVLAKLGMSRRSEAAAFAARLDERQHRDP